MLSVFGDRQRLCDRWTRRSWRTSAPFVAAHFIPLLAVFTGVHTGDLVLLAALYVGRVFFITAGYHRLLAHRSFKVGRALCWRRCHSWIGTKTAVSTPRFVTI